MLAPSTNARATPPKLACARSSPIKARPFRTTKLPRIPQIAATSTEARSPRCIKPNSSGSVRYSSTMTALLYGDRTVTDLQDHEVALVSLVQKIRREDFFWFPEGNDPPVEEQGEVETLGDAGEIVGRDDHGLAVLL